MKRRLAARRVPSKAKPKAAKRPSRIVKGKPTATKPKAAAKTSKRGESSALAGFKEDDERSMA